MCLGSLRKGSGMQIRIIVQKKHIFRYFFPFTSSVTDVEKETLVCMVAVFGLYYY